jgi:hypothetical protein
MDENYAVIKVIVLDGSNCKGGKKEEETDSKKG